MANRRVWNDGRREALTKAVSANFAAMANSPGGRASDAPVPRRMGLMDALNELTGGGWRPGVDDGRGRTGDNGYTGFQALPRDPGNDTAFGPMDPLTPEAIDRLDGDGRTNPRAFEYQVGWNLPGSGQKSTPWGVLRAAADGIGIIRRCIEMRKKDVRTLKWSFAPTEDAINEAYGKNITAGRLDAEQRLREELMPEIKRMRERWQKPWKANDKDFGDWANAVMEDALVLDGVAIHPRRTLGGDVFDLEYIDATTIKLLLDEYGRRPQPPFPAFQQILYGFPRGEWRATTTTETDERGQEIQVLRDGFSIDQLYYHVSNSRSFTPYGLSPVEMALFDSRLYLQRMKWMLAEYDDGSTPMTWIETAPSEDGKTMTLTQQRLWEKAFNAKNGGNTRERHRSKVLPHGWKAVQMSTVDERYRPEYDLYLIKLLASYFGVTATRLGFGESNGLGGSGFHEGQMEVTGELGLKPDTEILTDIINNLSCQVLGMDPRIAFAFVDPSSANTAEQATIMGGHVDSGVLSRNEVRQALGESLLPYPEANMQTVLAGPQGIIFLDGAKAAVEQAAAAQQMQAETQALGTAGKLSLEEKKLDDGKAAREEGREFAREEREAEVTKSAEIDAFRRWRRKQGDTPRRPFMFKTVGPDDGWAELDGLGPDIVAFEGWEWLADEDLDKAAKKDKSPFDWIGWNKANPLHPKGPNGRWVKRGSDLHTALIAEGERHARATGLVSDAPTTVKPMNVRKKIDPKDLKPGMVYTPDFDADGIASPMWRVERMERKYRQNGMIVSPLNPNSRDGSMPRWVPIDSGEHYEIKAEYDTKTDRYRPKIEPLSEARKADLRDQRAEQIARTRMDVIEAARKRVMVLGDLEEALDAEMDTAALRRSTRASVRQHGLEDDPVIAGLAGVVETSTDAGDIRRHMNMAASRLGLQRVDAKDRYSLTAQRTTGESLTPGDPVQQVRPGYAIEHEGEFIVVERPVVESRIPEPEPDQRMAQMEAHIQAAEDDTLEWIASKGGKVRTDQVNIRRLERLEAKGLITLRDAKRGSLRGEPHERRYSEFRRSIELTEAGRAYLARKATPEPEAPKADSGEDKRAREWRTWAQGGGTPIEAHAVPKEETLTGADKHSVFLPDGITGYVDRGNPKKPILRDIETDEVLFTGSSMPDIWRKVSAHYGATVKHHHQGTDKVTRYGEMGDPFEAPAGREYAPVRTERPAMNLLTGEGFAEWKADAEAFIAANTPKPITDARGRVWEHRGRNLFVHGDMAWTKDMIAEVEPLDIDAARKELAELEAFKANDVPLWKPTPLGERVKEPTKAEADNIKRHQFANGRIEVLRRDIAHYEATHQNVGIDASSFVTSKVNAHSLRRGDMVVVTGRAGSVVSHERVGDHIMITLDDGRALKLGLNEPLPRVHGGNLRKAVEPGEGPGDADPKAQEPATAPPPPEDLRWPGWLLDMIIATLIAQALVDALTAPGMAISALVRRFYDWLGGWQSGDPVFDIRGWLGQTGTLERIVEAITPAIRDAHTEGAFVGQRAAQAVLDALGEFGDARHARNALEMSIDWGGWTPGHPEAARALLDAPGLENLLYQSGVTIRGIAEGRLDEIARILSEGLARGDAPDTIARALAERLGDSRWAKMTAVTETNRAMSYAAVQEYRRAGLRYKGWMTAFDQRVCPICKHNEFNEDGSPRIVPIDELFPSGDPWPPAHPRCRCAPIPILQWQIDALGLTGNINKALTVAQWNVQHPLNPKGRDGKWIDALPGFDILDETAYFSQVAADEHDSPFISGEFGDQMRTLRLSEDHTAHFVKDLDDAYQILSGKLTEEDLRTLRDALHIDPFEGRGRALSGSDLARSVQLPGNLTLWPLPDGRAHLVRTTDSAPIATLDRMQRLELHDIVDHMINYSLPDLHGKQHDDDDDWDL